MESHCEVAAYDHLVRGQDGVVNYSLLLLLLPRALCSALINILKFFVTRNVHLSVKMEVKKC